MWHQNKNYKSVMIIFLKTLIQNYAQAVRFEV